MNAEELSPGLEQCGVRELRDLARRIGAPTRKTISRGRRVCLPKDELIRAIRRALGRTEAQDGTLGARGLTVNCR
jgi:hypothetical protein